MQTNKSLPSSPAALYLIPAIMSVIGLAHLPYGYYQLLRLVITGTAAYLAWRGFERGDWSIPAIFALVALLFNPLFPVHFEREQWAVVNVGVAALYLAAFILHRRQIHQK